MGVFLSKSKAESISQEPTDESQCQTKAPESETAKTTKKRSIIIDNQFVMKSQGYDLFETIGQGAYAVVKRGYSERMERTVAVKMVDQERVPAEVKNKFLPRELRVSMVVKHENVIQCFEVFRANYMIYMVLEMVENGDLLSYILKNDFIEERTARKIFTGVATAVRYLHDNHIVHRDLKLENILLDKNLVPKLSDFGFARHARPTEFCDTFCGSAAYAPFEILSGFAYDPFQVDIWCLGVILYTMTVGYMPFSDGKHKKEIKKGANFKETKQPITKQLKDLIRKILVLDANARLPVKNILEHKWLQERSAEPNRGVSPC